MNRFVQTVLIVEDEADNRELLGDILGDQYNIIMAADGAEGLEKLREHAGEVCVVILDLVMPVMNGYEFLDAARRDSKIAGIPIIVISSESRELAEDTCIELGAVDFMPKPCGAKLLQTRVRTLIRMYEASQMLTAFETDELTGLYTKQAFIRRAEELVNLETDKEYGLVAFDIENFKLTNNQYGEAMCDEFLRYLGEQVATRMNVFELAGRFGGDQFVILFEADKYGNGFDLNRIDESVLANAPVPHQIINAGVYAPIPKGVPIVRCCDRAFLAIRGIKGVYGKNLAFYDEKIREQLEEELELQDAMDEALEQKQFKVFYQPKHDSATGKVSGAEALIRWIHPEWGFMSPGRFIPLFEKNGFITKIDSFVVDQVCEDLLKWTKEGVKVVPISINVSRRDYYEQGWLDKQIAKIDSYGIDHSLIHIEVTESLYAENTDVILEQVKKVRERDIMIEMDDFGAGYSSLGMLASFTFDIIKLDISFVRRIEINQVVIESIINLAHKMGFKTIAEGVETKQQFDILKELGCDYIQGYYFSKPLPESDYAEYIKKAFME